MWGARFSRLSRSAACVVGAAGVGVLLFYVNRLFAELPLYAGDEGAYLIRALYARPLALDPERYRALQAVGNTAYFALIRLVDLLSLNVVQWMRLLGAACYFGGLAMLYPLAVREAGRTAALGALLAAAAFPYYRFVFAAMPEGPYVGLLCLIVVTIHQTYLTRPLTGAVAVGALSAVLVLIKPHGVAAALAFLALSMGIGAWRGEQPWRVAVRLAMFLGAFLLVGGAIQLAAGEPPERAALFFTGSSFYAAQMSRALGPAALPMAALAAAGMGALCAMFVAAPLTAWAASVLRDGRLRARNPTAGDIAVLFVVLALAASVAMVTVFAFKVSVSPGETRRIWGRYFEFFVPMLWLLSARPMEQWASSARRVAAVIVAGGLGALMLVMSLGGVKLYPWDGTAMNAFAVDALPPLAILATLAVSVVTATRLSTARAWTAYFVVLGLLSTRADDRWVGEIAARNARIEHELHMARSLTDDRHGEVLVVVDSLNDGHVAFLRLRGRPRVEVVGPGVVEPKLIGHATSLVAFGAHAPGPGWSKAFSGETLAVYVPQGGAGQ